MAHGLIIFKRWNDELKELPKFLIVFTAAVVELLVENYCVWCAQCVVAKCMPTCANRVACDHV